MKPTGIIAIVKNGLYVSALHHIVENLRISDNLEFHVSFESCLKKDISPSCVVIQKECIPVPERHSLERLKSKFSESNFVLLNSELLDSDAKVFCDAEIVTTDSEQVILNKFRSIYSSFKNSDQVESSDNSLSDREVEVVRLVALGKTNKEISEQLFISTHTVITHRKNITNKLGIKTIAGLAVFAVLNGIVDPGEVNQ